MTPKTTRCRDCCQEFTKEEIEGKTACPSCKTTRFPIAISQDVLLPINWHELRCLTMWATWWIERTECDGERNINDTRIWLQKLLNRINQYRPEGGGALTFAQEVKECQKEIPGISLLNNKGEVIIPSKEESD